MASSSQWNHTRYRVLTVIGESVGVRLTHAAKLSGLPNRQTRLIVDDLKHDRLVVEIGRLLYLASPGRSLLAQHSRSDYQSVTRMLGRSPKSPPNDRGTKRSDGLSS